MGKTVTAAVLRFDGACTPNPGKGSWGFSFSIDDHFYEESGRCEGTTTNNCAEWEALINGLMHIITHWEDVGYLIIEGDSKLVIDQLTGEMKCKKDDMKAYCRVARTILNRMDCHWMAKWIPREKNQNCDRLSKEGRHKTKRFTQNF